MEGNLSYGRAMSEARAAKRYTVTLPVVVTSETQAAAIAATVRDISSQGVFLYLPQDAAAGPQINFALALPEQVTHREGVRIECKGTVVRVERVRNDGLVGVAAKITSYKFMGSKPEA